MEKNFTAEWKLNQTIADERKKLGLKVARDLKSRHDERVATARNDQRSQLYASIHQFESTLNHKISSLESDRNRSDTSSDHALYQKRLQFLKVSDSNRCNMLQSRINQKVCSLLQSKSAMEMYEASLLNDINNTIHSMIDNRRIRTEIIHKLDQERDKRKIAFEKEIERRNEDYIYNQSIWNKKLDDINETLFQREKYHHQVFINSLLDEIHFISDWCITCFEYGQYTSISGGAEWNTQTKDAYMKLGVFNNDILSKVLRSDGKYFYQIISSSLNYNTNNSTTTISDSSELVPASLLSHINVSTTTNSMTIKNVFISIQSTESWIYETLARYYIQSLLLKTIEEGDAYDSNDNNIHMISRTSNDDSHSNSNSIELINNSLSTGRSTIIDHDEVKQVSDIGSLLPPYTNSHTKMIMDIKYLLAECHHQILTYVSSLSTAIGPTTTNTATTSSNANTTITTKDILLESNSLPAIHVDSLQKNIGKKMMKINLIQFQYRFVILSNDITSSHICSTILQQQLPNLHILDFSLILQSLIQRAKQYYTDYESHPEDAMIQRLYQDDMEKEYSIALYNTIVNPDRNGDGDNKVVNAAIGTASSTKIDELYTNIAIYYLHNLEIRIQVHDTAQTHSTIEQTLNDNDNVNIADNMVKQGNGFVLIGYPSTPNQLQLLFDTLEIQMIQNLNLDGIYPYDQISTTPTTTPTTTTTDLSIAKDITYTTLAPRVYDYKVISPFTSCIFIDHPIDTTTYELYHNHDLVTLYTSYLTQYHMKELNDMLSKYENQVYIDILDTSGGGGGGGEDRQDIIRKEITTLCQQKYLPTSHTSSIDVSDSLLLDGSSIESTAAAIPPKSQSQSQSSPPPISHVTPVATLSSTTATPATSTTTTNTIEAGSKSNPPTGRRASETPTNHTPLQVYLQKVYRFYIQGIKSTQEKSTASGIQLFKMTSIYRYQINIFKRHSIINEVKELIQSIDNDGQSLVQICLEKWTTLDSDSKYDDSIKTEQLTYIQESRNKLTDLFKMKKESGMEYIRSLEQDNIVSNAIHHITVLAIKYIQDEYLRCIYNLNMILDHIIMTNYHAIQPDFTCKKYHGNIDNLLEYQTIYQMYVYEEILSVIEKETSETNEWNTIYKKYYTNLITPPTTGTSKTKSKETAKIVIKKPPKYRLSSPIHMILFDETKDVLDVTEDSITAYVKIEAPVVDKKKPPSATTNTKKSGAGKNTATSTTAADIINTKPHLNLPSDTLCIISTKYIHELKQWLAEEYPTHRTVYSEHIAVYIESFIRFEIDKLEKEFHHIREQVEMDITCLTTCQQDTIAYCNHAVDITMTNIGNTLQTQLSDLEIDIQNTIHPIESTRTPDTAEGEVNIVTLSPRMNQASESTLGSSRK